MFVKNAFHRADVYVVHRLDREVSGIVIFAKSREIQMRIKEKLVHDREALLRTGGRPAAEVRGNHRKLGCRRRAAESPIGSKVFPRGARNAVTYYRTLKSLGDHTLLEIFWKRAGKPDMFIWPISAALLWVIGGMAPDRFIRRIRLHGFLLAFNHPANGKRISVLIPGCRQDF